MPRLLESLTRDHAVDSDHTVGVPCRNCGVPLSGPFCAQCGQRVTPPNPTTRELLAEAWESFANVDGKIVVTLRDLMRHPGRLTREYLAGRRVRYLPPVRLYLICSVAYFLLAAAEEKLHPDPDGKRQGVVRVTETEDARPTSARPSSTASTTTAPASPPRGAVRRLWNARKEVFIERLKRDGDQLNTLANKNIPRVMFFLVPVFALLLSGVYRNRRWRLPAHLVVALHFHAFVFVSMSTITIVAMLFDERLSPWMELSLLAWIVGYGLATLRGIYGGRWRTTVARGVVLGMGYSVAALIGFAGLLLVLLLSFAL